MVAVTDSIGVALRDGLVDGLGSVGFACVDGPGQEVAVGVHEGGLVVHRRVSGLVARQVKGHDGQSGVSQAHSTACQLLGCLGVERVGLGLSQGPAEIGKPSAKAGLEHAHCAQDQPKVEGGQCAGHHLRLVGVLPLGALQTTGHGAHHPLHAHLWAHVKLGREANLDVADVLLQVVQGELVGAALQGLWVLEHCSGQGKARQVLG